VNGRYILHLTRDERDLLLDALSAVESLPLTDERKVKLIRKISDVRDKSNSNTAGIYEFKGLFCTFCVTTTSHYKRYKSRDKFTCDVCGA
jgi:hypothetical protein